MKQELSVQRVEVGFVGVSPFRQVCGSFQPFLEALRGHEVVSLSSKPLTTLEGVQ